MAKQKIFKLARQHCLDASRGIATTSTSGRAEIRSAAALGRAVSIKAAESFKDGMRVTTPDGTGKVCDASSRKGSIGVRVDRFPRPRYYPAASLTKL